MIAAKLNPGEVGEAGTQFARDSPHAREGGGERKWGKRRERRKGERCSFDSSHYGKCSDGAGSDVEARN